MTWLYSNVLQTVATIFNTGVASRFVPEGPEGGTAERTASAWCRVKRYFKRDPLRILRNIVMIIGGISLWHIMIIGGIL